MNPPPDISDAALRAWLDGTLPPDEAQRTEAALEHDPAVAERLDELAGVEEFCRTHSGGALPEFSAALPAELMARLKAADFSLTDDEDAVFALLDAAPRDGQPGKLGAFEIHGLLAAGGMGFVFDGFDPALRRRVAIKMPSPHLGSDLAARARFMAEAQAVAALDHPHIVPIHSVHAHGDAPFFVMPMADGLTLAQHVAKHGPLSAEDASRVALHAARALAAAHARGIVHRDVKPANLLMEPDRVRLTDFGIAQSAGMSGAFSGTPEFMSPEQQAGAPVNAASDIWSLGATLRAALRATDRDTMPSLPAGSALARLLPRMLAANPEQRPTAAEIVSLLEQPARARNWKRLALRLTAAAAALTVLTFTAIRIPATADLLNRALVSPQRAFVVDGKFGAHPTLDAAIAAAADGSTITIHADGPWTLRDVTTSGTLTIRAAENARPRFLVESTDHPGLTSRGALTLERLTIHRSSGTTDAHGILNASAGTLTLRRCDIRATAAPRRDAAFPAAIVVCDGAALHLDRSAIIGTWTAAVAVRSNAPASSSLRLTHSALIGMPVILLHCQEGSTVRIEGNRCSLPSPILFADAPAAPLPWVEATFTSCHLRADTTLWWLPGESDATIRTQFHWTGTDNLFAPDSPFLTTAARAQIRSRSGREDAALANWQAWPGVEEVRPATDDLPHARTLNGSLPAQPAASLAPSAWNTLTAPWHARYPDVGAHFPSLWP